MKIEGCSWKGELIVITSLVIIVQICMFPPRIHQREVNCHWTVLFSNVTTNDKLSIVEMESSNWEIKAEEITVEMPWSLFTVMECISILH